MPGPRQTGGQILGPFLSTAVAHDHAGAGQSRLPAGLLADAARPSDDDCHFAFKGSARSGHRGHAFFPEIGGMG
ncbi:hypothetical protein D9M70_624130 [compost metagenome]